jgi:hypothetical protein
MRKWMAFTLALVLAQGCASGGIQPSSTTVPGRDRQLESVERLQAINDDLEGVQATVELATGEVVTKAEAVQLGPESTSWRDAAGHERTVRTAEVVRVLRDPHHAAGKGFGYGAAAAVLPSYLVFNNAGCHSNCGDEPFSGAGRFAAGVLVVVAGGLIGMLIRVGTRHPVVVYQAPAPRAAAAPGFDLRCSLAPDSAKAWLDCRPAQ